MINSQALLTDLKQQLKVLQADLRERAEDPASAWGQRLKQQHQRALDKGRTGYAWVTWRDGEVDQAAVAWLVATTFIRFCEDNHLLDGARDAEGRQVPTLWLAGPGERTARAVEYENEFFRAQPSANRRDWMQQAFGVLAAQPAGRALVDPNHSLVWKAPISAHAADGLAAFWRRTTPDGENVHDFTDPDLGTRFLGDLYQDLSEHAKKTYALLQTPDFVEEFILDLTLTPAIEEFGLAGLKLIDPTCGSGHFLLGAFERLNRLWAEQEPGADVRERVQKAMDSIHGVDINPFAVAIARFRLTVAGLKAAGLRSLVDAPAFEFHLAVGDSLLGEQGTQGDLDLDGLLDLGDGLNADTNEVGFQYDAEDLSEYQGILTPGQYHVVVGNPPYITVKDKALSDAYRSAYKTTAGKYALSVPFAELFFRLAIRGSADKPAGFAGQITSNSFMKREFGKKLIENLFAGADATLATENPVDLTHVIDSSGAWMPGHNFDGTPTVILVGRRRRPVAPVVRTVLGVTDDPGKRPDPENGPVWAEIVTHLNGGEFDGTYVTVTDLDRRVLSTFPWSLSGGGAGDVFEVLESMQERLRQRLSMEIGFASFPGNDEPFFLGDAWFKRDGDRQGLGRQLVLGELVRDWGIAPEEVALTPYDDEQSPLDLDESASWARHLWRFRRVLEGTTGFGGETIKDAGGAWWTWYRWVRERYMTPMSITFAEVATHNHFVLDRGGKVFKQTAPVIKLAANATEQDHLDLLGVLNSSVACFWLKQVVQKKGGDADVPWIRTYQFNATNVGKVPLPKQFPGERARVLDELSRSLEAAAPSAVLARLAASGEPVMPALTAAAAEWSRLRERLVFEQEELDWETYRLYGLIEQDMTAAVAETSRATIGPSERAFAILLARNDTDASSTAWFDYEDPRSGQRHQFPRVLEIPNDWDERYRALVRRRLDIIATNTSIRLLEKPEFKRRWATAGWDALQRQALMEAILDRLEFRDLWFDRNGQPLPRSIGELADAVRSDDFLVQCAQVLAGSPEIDLAKVLVDLLKDRPVPYLAAQRYKESGVEKYREWQRVWELQRREDAGEKVSIPVPPKYAPTDFRPGVWQHRGKLDVPKERFIAYPGVVRPGDSTPVIGWTGWNHAEQAQALAGEFQRQFGLGAEPEQLKPLVAGLVELEPWLDQWHGEIDPRFGQSPAQAIRGAVDAFAASLNVTRDELNAWRPPAPTRGRRAKAAQ
ncbi:BREX-2 system adenine-specific DNA-methyltransferase PglX [Cellulosimicrobium sp. BIT-GX5]|uniref:site-specific DNA-methyltransferase (adenine-specific) n=1 Tax=Cellulosimicrobium composti TaxID=2672572 RepID=A0A6N7ZMI3_9MICO|nr:BREX-2 system adenine-specific DNA-methyltransferase PglX [Cellulosimicrobium composti]MTG90711.1 BREX-2 system adenine-specific DNA-methyltransferase PglX [Cellulosimicrobium composti]